jgi:hypothetical protein
MPARREEISWSAAEIAGFWSICERLIRIKG